MTASLRLNAFSRSVTPMHIAFLDHLIFKCFLWPNSLYDIGLMKSSLNLEVRSNRLKFVDYFRMTDKVRGINNLHERLVFYIIHLSHVLSDFIVQFRRRNTPIKPHEFIDFHIKLFTRQFLNLTSLLLDRSWLHY